MAFLVLVGGVQFVYCVIAGNYVRRGLSGSSCLSASWLIEAESLLIATG